MAKQQSYRSKSAVGKRANDEGGRVVHRDLMKVNPKKGQFEPTAAEPVRQRYKMAGGC